MTMRVRDFTLVELERMTGARSRTLHMSVYRGHLKATTVKHKLVVRYKEAKEFVWRYLVAKLTPTPKQMASSLAGRVKPVRIYQPQDEREKRWIGKRRFATREVARKYLQLTEGEYRNFAFKNFDQTVSICGKRLWPAEFLESCKAKQLYKRCGPK